MSILAHFAKIHRPKEAISFSFLVCDFWLASERTSYPELETGTANQKSGTRN